MGTEQFPEEEIIAPGYVGDSLVVTDMQWAGQYYIIKDLSPGDTYRFYSSADSTDYITIRDRFDMSVVLAQGLLPLEYMITGPDILSVHINLAIGCGSDTIDRTTSVICLSCPDIPPAVGVHTSVPGAALEVAGEVKLGMDTRPAVAGMIRWNPTSNDFEGYTGEEWKSFTQWAPAGSWGQKVQVVLEGNEDQNVIASDGNPEAAFGSSVHISGDYAIIGAPMDSIGSNGQQGSAYIFERVDGIWTEQQKLTASDGAADDHFGFSVSISGDFTVVGAYSDDISSNVDQGSAYIFQRIGNTWVEQAKLTASDGSTGDEFGYSVSISGDDVSIGSHFDDIGFTDAGSVYVFQRLGNTWPEQIKLLASDGTSFDEFGHSVCISDDDIIVGAYDDDEAGGGDQGSAYIFNRVGGIWTEQQKLTASDGGQSDRFGSSVSIHEDYALIGAWLDDIGSNPDQGSAYIFHRNAGIWTQQQKLTASDGSSSNRFGTSVSLSGADALIGARNTNIESMPLHGSAYVYHREGTNWSEQAKLIASDGVSEDYFGWSVSLLGSDALIGATGDDIGTNENQGSVYFFRKE